jgi:hydrogenase maturation protease
VCDDGIGARVGRILRSLPLPSDVAVTVVQGIGLDLSDALAAAEQLIVVDALDSEAEPGTCTVADVTELPAATVGTGCAHESYVAQIIEMARQLSCDGVLKSVTLAGIERKLTLGFCTGFSDEVTAAVPRLVDLILLTVGAELDARVKVKETCRRFVVPTSGAVAMARPTEPRSTATAMWQ